MAAPAGSSPDAGLAPAYAAARTRLGLVAALFQHAYIWVHYVCTEQPDMARLYGEPATPRG